MQGITPFLWFNDQAEESGEFLRLYLLRARQKRLEDQASHSLWRSWAWTEGDGHDRALNLPSHKPSRSLVNCETQEEVGELWEKLSEGGEKHPCAWLKDKYSVPWQIVRPR